MRRGDIYWVRFPAPAGVRPAVLVTRDEGYSIKSNVTVVPLTRTIRGIPTEVRVGPSDGLPKVGVANADEITTVSQTLLGERVATLSSVKMRHLDDAIRFALGLDRSP